MGGGRRGEAHNAMGHGGWTDSICSQLSVALVMDGELERHRESMKVGERGRRGWRKKMEGGRGHGRKSDKLYKVFIFTLDIKRICG